MQLSFGRHTRDYLAAMTAVDSEILVCRQDNGSAKISVIRTRQASARLMGMLEYFPISFVTGSRCSASWKEITRARLPSNAPTARAPRFPRRWYASETAASQVDQGGGKSDAWLAAHS